MSSSDYSSAQKYSISGRSIDEIREKLYRLYGDEYSIVDRQTNLKGGFLGLFQKNQITVWYVLRDKSVEREDFNKSKEQLLKKSGIDTSALALKQNAAVLNMLQAVSEQVEQIKNATTTEVHPSIAQIENLLTENEFSHVYISEIASKLRNEFSLEELDDFALVQKKVVDWIGLSISLAPKITPPPPHVIVLVGPTGVGKTTTISKLAAMLILEARKNGRADPHIRMITADRTRVGAEEQLRRLGDVMSVPMDKAETAEDLNTLFRQYKKHEDYILIDTSGYSPNDYENIAKTRALLDIPGINFDIYLTVSACTKASDLVKIIQNYEVFNCSSVIITKCDETSTYGNILSVLHEKHKSISYITDGQKVHTCIRRATVVEFLKNLSGFEIDRLHINDKFPEDK